MTIEQIIIHQLKPAANGELLQAVPAGQLLTPTPNLEVILSHLTETYNKKEKRHGMFDLDSESTFAGELSNSLDGDHSFVELTANVLTTLTEQLNQFGALGGGYLLCADCKIGLTQQLMIFLLNCHESVTITQDLMVEQVAYLDISKMPWACRINVTEWQNNAEGNRYLSFLRTGSSNRLGDAFQQALGITGTGDSRKESKTLVSAVKEYAKETDSPENHQALSRQVYDYCQEKVEKGDALTLNELADYLDKSGADDFARFVNTRDYDMDQPINPEKRTLKALIQYTGRSNGLSISFDARLLGDQVRYNKELDQLVIREVPGKLKQQLEENS